MIVIAWLSTTGEWGFSWGSDLHEIAADFDGSLFAERDGLRFDNLQWQQLNESAAKRAFMLLHGGYTLDEADSDSSNIVCDAWDRAIAEYGPFEE